MTFSIWCGGLCWLTLPWLAHSLWRQPPWVRWPSLIAAIIAAGSAGAVGAAATLFYGFGFPTEAPFGAFLAAALRTAVPIAVIIGVGFTVVEALRSRLHSAESELRKQQLERERADKLAAEARLAALTARVQPHFLFNTLNSISALIKDEPERAERTIERLSGLLRSSLENEQTVPLEREFRLVSDYLEIQRVRFGDRLRFGVPQLLDGVAGALVPPFAVQTLVENAVKHVAERRQGGASIHIAASRSGPDVVIDVVDDGPGFDQQAIAAGHGLDVLRQRLGAIYGAAAALDFLPGAAGMTVRLRVPAA
jgi:LytS/YehU family sensor histidine kinase